MMIRKIFAWMLATCIMVGLISALPENVKAAPAPDTVPDNAWDFMPHLNVGWNLGNSLENQTLSEGFIPSERFPELETRLRNPVTTEELIEAVADAGFSSIRIPVSFYNHLKGSEPAVGGVPKAGTEIDDAWLARIKEVVDWAYRHDLYVIINNHHDTSMWNTMSWIHADKKTYEVDKEYYQKLWERVATYFKDYDHHLIFQSTGEIVNTKEGEHRFTASESWQDFQVAHDYNQLFIDTVRETGGNNTDRFLILETYGANAEPVFVDQCFYKEYTDKGSKNKLIFGVHCYHNDPEELRAVFKGLAQKSVQYGMPFIIDECGTKYSLDQEQRVAVAKTLSQESARYGAAVMIWDDGHGEFGLIDRAATIENKTAIGYEVVPGDPSHTLESKRIVEALLYAKTQVIPLTREELKALYDSRYQVSDFHGLNASNVDILKPGQYSQTHEDAANPVSEYIPTPANYAALYPYVYAEGAHFIATLPDGVTVIVREHDKHGNYMKTVTVQNGGYYIPPENAAFLGIGFRKEDESMRIEKYKAYVLSGKLRLHQDGYDYSAYSVALKDATRFDGNKVTVSWETLPGADGYRVMRRESTDAIWIPLGQLLDSSYTSYTDDSAEEGKEYYYTVKPFILREEAGMRFRLFGGYDHQGILSHS